MLNYCLALRELGYTISYVPSDNLTHQQDKAALMGARGIHVLSQPQITSVDDIFESRAASRSLIRSIRAADACTISCWCRRSSSAAASCASRR